MRKINLLGISDSYVAIIMDLIEEIEEEKVFIFYPNIASNIIPILPLKKMNYRIMPLGSAPKKTSNVLFARPGSESKNAVFKYFQKNHGIERDKYRRLIHPSSYIGSSAKISFGVIIEPHVIVSSQTEIGFGVFLKRGSSVGHHCFIDDFTDINPGVVISSNVKIGKRCLIGSGAVIRDSISIGDDTIIGMGSVVTKDVPAKSIAYGNPCRVKR